MGVEVYLHGATITQWLRPNGSEALDSHPALELHPDKGNKGAGLRLAFPQYRAGTSMTLDDGFAGRLPWEVVAAVSGWGVVMVWCGRGGRQGARRTAEQRGQGNRVDKGPGRTWWTGVLLVWSTEAHFGDTAA